MYVFTCVGTGVVICFIWLYLAGWNYAYYFFSVYHIKVSELHIDLGTLLIYGYRVVQFDAVSVALLCVSITASLYLMWRTALPTPWVALLSVLGVVAILSSAEKFARIDANTTNAFAKGPLSAPTTQWFNAAVVLTPDSAANMDAAMVEALRNGCLTVLWATDGILYLTDRRIAVSDLRQRPTLRLSGTGIASATMRPAFPLPEKCEPAPQP